MMNLIFMAIKVQNLNETLSPVTGISLLYLKRDKFMHFQGRKNCIQNIMKSLTNFIRP